jgi:hypothetical protein
MKQGKSLRDVSWHSVGIFPYLAHKLRPTALGKTIVSIHAPKGRFLKKITHRFAKSQEASQILPGTVQQAKHHFLRYGTERRPGPLIWGTIPTYVRWGKSYVHGKPDSVCSRLKLCKGMFQYTNVLCSKWSRAWLVPPTQYYMQVNIQDRIWGCKQVPRTRPVPGNTDIHEHSMTSTQNLQNQKVISGNILLSVLQ